MNDKDSVRISEFSINGQQYLILRYGSQPFKESDIKLNTRLSDTEIVGEITIKDKRYLVVQQKKNGSNIEENQGDGLRSPTDLLTQRELQIVMLVAEGRVDKQIANQLKISKYTVSTHLRRIFAKLGVDSRAAMIYRCLKLIEQLQKKWQISNSGKQL